MAKRPERYPKDRTSLALILWNALFVGESDTGYELLRRLAMVARYHPAEFAEDIAEAFTIMLDGIEKVRGWSPTTQEAKAAGPARVLPLVPRVRGDAPPEGGAA